MAKVRLFNHVSACLQELVDGNNVDRFHCTARHFVLGELTLDGARTESDQIRVMVSYWMQQISAMHRPIPDNVIGLMQHRRIEDFMPGFQAYLIPLIEELNLPVQTRPIQKESYCYG